MDGIFGVGLPEMLIIGLALFVIGGPKNSAKWARELGKFVRQAREAWAQVVADLETEMGPEGKEIMDAARELGQGAREMRSMNPTRRVMNETLRMVESSVNLDEDEPRGTTEQPASSVAPPGEASSGDVPSKNGKKYAAWLPPESRDNA